MTDIPQPELEILRAQEVKRAQQAAEQLWQRPEIGFYKELHGAFLGATPRSNNMGSTYKDEHDEALPEVGIIVRASQSSAGYTGISALPLKGFTVEALNPDASSKKTMWRGTSWQEEDNEVNVCSDFGAMETIANEDWATANFGNPGTRFGVVRVTNEDDGTQKFYALGATFRGEPDSWHVTGKIVEVQPTEKMAIASAVQELGGTGVQGVLDSLLNGSDQPDADEQSFMQSVLGVEKEPVHTLEVATINDLYEAFTAATADTFSYADGPGYFFSDDDSRSSLLTYTAHNAAEMAKQTRHSAAKTYAQITVELLQQIAKCCPQVMFNTEASIDKLGGLVRRLDTSPNNGTKSFLYLLDDDETARVEYLQNLLELINSYAATEQNESKYEAVAHSAFALLKNITIVAPQVVLPQNAPVLQQVSKMIQADHEHVAVLKHQRHEVLRGSVLDQEAPKESTEVKALVSLQKVMLSTEGYTPLLTSEQTSAAFYYTRLKGSGGEQAFGYDAPTLAMIVVGDKRYALLDMRSRGTVRRSKATGTADNHYNARGEQFVLLQLQQQDDRYGTATIGQALRFNEDTTIVQMYDHTAPRGGQEQKKQAELGISVAFDEVNKQLVLVAASGRAMVITAPSTMTVAPTEAIDKMPIEKRQKYVLWQREVTLLQQEIDQLRKNLQRQLDDRIASGNVTQEQAEQIKARNEAIVARGIPRSYTYNGYRGDTWHRAQTYYATVDEDGTIWGDFEKVTRDTSNVTGKPVAPGKHVLHKKPVL